MNVDIVEKLDFEEILRRNKALFLDLQPEQKREDWANTLELESEPVVKLLQLFSYLEILLRGRVNYAASQNFVNFASGGNLDHLALFYDLKRFNNESDEDFRKRLLIRIQGSSTAGPAEYYKWHALDASPLIKSVLVSSSRAGLVEVVILTHDLGHTEEALNLATERLNSAKVKVLTDTLKVYAAKIKPFNLQATLKGNITEKSALEAKIKQHFSNLRLGASVAKSSLIALLHGEEVQKVELVEPQEDLQAAADEVLQLVNLEINYE